MPTISDYLTYANLQMAAEAFLTNDEEEPLSGQFYIDALIDGNKHASKFTETQAGEFAAQWKVVDQQENTTTGFSGTLFRAIKDNPALGIKKDDLVISVRSTEFIDDSVRDNMTNQMELKKFGFAFGQVADMKDWYDSLVSNGTLNESDKFTLTGYSLGASVATAFDLLMKDRAQNSANPIPNPVSSLYTFNGAGVGDVTSGTLWNAIDEFDKARTNGNGNFFTDTVVKQTYTNVLGKLDSVTLLSRTEINDALLIISNAMDSAVSLPTGDVRTARLDKLNLLYEAVHRIGLIFDEAIRINKGIYSGGVNADGTLVPDANPVGKVGDDISRVKQSEIASLDLDYQLGILRASTHTASFNSDIVDGLDQAYATDRAPLSGLDNVYDIYGSPLPSAVANSQHHYGQNTPIYIENQPLMRGNYIAEVAAANLSINTAVLAASGNFLVGAGIDLVKQNLFGEVKLLVNGFTQNDFGDTHSLVLLVDSLSVQNVLAQLDPTVSQNTINSIFRIASNLTDSSFIFTQGKAEGDVLENVITGLADILGVSKNSAWKKLNPNPNGGTWATIEDKGGYTGRDTFYKDLQLLTQSTAFQALQGKVKIESFSSKSYSDLVSSAKTNFGVFLSLKLGLTFALAPDAYEGTGILQSTQQDLADLWQPDLALNDTDRAEGKANFSDQWLTDRAKMISWLVTRNAGNTPVEQAFLSNTVTEKWRFHDYANGTVINVNPVSAILQPPQHYIKFGKDSADVAPENGFIPNGDYLDGGNSSDFLYGGGGDDTLDGGKGNDYLEGNADNDSLISGIGNDTLLGGTGNDTLNGGVDSDMLKGGAGNDTYVFAAGDGVDTIIDSDGAGKIQIGEIVLSGGKEKVKGTGIWISEDKKFQYSLVSETDGSKTLSITNIASPTDRIFVKKYTSEKNLGIVLEDGLVIAPPPPANVTVLGDLAPIDANPAAEGIQLSYDALGNVVVDPNQADPDRNDHLFDGAGDDLIKAGGGDDVIENLRGGNDRYEGGAGNDDMYGGTGKDVLLGGTGHDHVFGNAGDDFLYADGEIETAQAIENGRTGTGTNVYGDWLRGGRGSDVVIAGADNDILFGGGDEDVIVGGAGDDVINGDDDYQPMQGYRDSTQWSVTVDRDNFKIAWAHVDNYYDYARLVGAADLIYAGKGNDVITAQVGDDVVYGEAGEDLIRGDEGNDRLYGGDDNDRITGDSGLRVNSGDNVATEPGDDLLDGGNGDDWLQGEGGNDILLGGEGNDELWGDAHIYREDTFNGNDYLDGGAGNDTLNAQGGDDTLFGGEGNDSLMGDEDITPLAKQGKDYLDGGEGDDYLNGYGGNDTLLGGDGSDTLLGGKGDDYLDGGKGDDQLDGGDGNDTLYAGEGSNTIKGGSGDDFLIGGEYFDSLEGGEGADFLYGGGGNNILRAGNGNDTLMAGSGIDYLYGGTGTVRIMAGAGVAHMYGGGGDNTYVFEAGFGTIDISGISKSDTIEFGSGISPSDLKLSASFAANHSPALLIEYGDGSITVTDGLDGAINRFVFSGGQVFTLKQLMGSATPVAVDINDGSNRIMFSAAANAVINAGNTGLPLRIYSWGQNDTLVGGTDQTTFVVHDPSTTIVAHPEASNSVISWANIVLPPHVQTLTLMGADDLTATGNAEGSVIVANEGNDTLISGAGNDTLIGGIGNDTFVVNVENDVVIAQADGGLDTIVTSVSYALPGHVDNLIGSGTADLTLTGNTLDNEITANDGNTTLIGGGGADTFIGGTGNNTFIVDSTDDVVIKGQNAGINTVISSVSYTLSDNVQNLTLTGTADMSATGNYLDNIITGSAGNDTLYGGAGHDTLIGGAGNNTYVMDFGMGQSTVTDAALQGSKVRLAAGLDFSDLSASRQGDDLLLKINGGDSSMRLQGYYLGTQGWSIDDAFGQSRAPQVLVDATAQVEADHVAQLWNDFSTSMKQYAVNSLRQSGYVMQEDGTFYKSYSLPNWGSQNVLSARYNSLYQVNTDSFLGTRTYFSESWTPLNYNYTNNGVDLHDYSMAINLMQTTADAAVVNVSSASNWSQAISTRWLPVAWNRTSMESTTTESSGSGFITGANGQPVGVHTWIETDTYTTSFYNGYAIGGLLSSSGSLRTYGVLPQAVAARYVHDQKTTNIQEVVLNDGDHVVHANFQTMVVGGNGNNQIFDAGLVYLTNGNNYIANAETAYGGDGNDTMIGGGTLNGGAGDDFLVSGEVMAGGDGNDGMFANGQISATFKVDAGSNGVDLIGGVGEPAQFVDTYYSAYSGLGNWQYFYQYGGMYLIGESLHPHDLQAVMDKLQDWGMTLQEALDSGEIGYVQPLPFLLNIPEVMEQYPRSSYYETADVPVVDFDANDFEALAPYYSSSMLAMKRVEFEEGISAGSLNLSWGAVMGSLDGQAASPQSSYVTLDISWGVGQGIRVMIPHSNDPIGSGVAEFEFADGTILSMADMIAMAPPVPNFDPDYTTVSDDGQGNVQTNYYHADGARFREEWTHADGSHGFTVFNSDGTRNGASYGPDGSYTETAVNEGGLFTSNEYDENGRLAYSSWSSPDGAHGEDTFNADGSSSGVSYQSNGGYATYTDDGHGNGSGLVFNASGMQIGSSWSYADGSYGYQTVNVAGVITTITFNTDGSHSESTDDGHGNIASTIYDTNGGSIDTWQSADGSYGTDTHNADGSGSGIAHDPDGNYRTSINDAQGNYTGWFFNADGVKTAGAWGKPDGSYGEDKFNTDGSSSGYADYPDGGHSTYTNDGQGNIVTLIFDANGVQIADTWNSADGSHGSHAYHVDGSSIVTTYQQDGSHSIFNDDGHGNTITSYFDTNDIKTGDTWQHADGSHGTHIFNMDGSSISDVYGADGSHVRYTDDGNGYVRTITFDADGNDTWEDSYGSHGSDVLNADGSSSGAIYYVGGSYSTYINDGQGNITTLNFDADGVQTGSVWQHADGSHGNHVIFPNGMSASYVYDALGNLVVKNFNAEGVLVEESWTNIDGSYGYDTFNPDGSSLGEMRHADGTYTQYSDDGQGNSMVLNMDANRIMTSSAWSHADGSYGEDFFHFSTDGSSSGNSHNADGSYSTYINDGQGNITTLSFKANGVLTSILWQHADGSSGSDIYYVDGSRVSTSTDQLGTVSIVNFDANDYMTSRQWTKLDGTHGAEVFGTDGSSSGRVDYPGGAYSIYTNDGQGNILSAEYDAVGNVVSNTWQYADGSHGNHLFNADGSSSSMTYHPDGSYASEWSDGQGNTMAITYQIDGSELYVWHNADGSYGDDTYYPDGSHDGTDHYPDGSYRNYAGDALGNSTSTTYDVNGIMIAGGWGKADGSYGEDTYHANGSSSGNVYYANGSTSSYVKDGHGNDTLVAGEGIVTLTGGMGNQVFVVNNPTDVVIAQSGARLNTIYSWVDYVAPDNVQNMYGMGYADLTLTGNGLNNFLWANAGNDLLIGGGGDDTFMACIGNATVVGGTGNDTYIYQRNDGQFTINDAGGNNKVRLGPGITPQNIALRLTTLDGKPYVPGATGANLWDGIPPALGLPATVNAFVGRLDANGNPIPGKGISFQVSQDSNGSLILPVQSFEFESGLIATFQDMLIKEQIINATGMTGVITSGRNDDVIYAGSQNSAIYLTSGNDIVYASNTGNLVYGGGGQNYLVGGAGNDTFIGGAGLAIMAGGDGNDTLQDLNGIAGILGGNGNDTIVTGVGDNFIVGGTGNDMITIGATHNVIAFNAGNGQDVINATPGAANTLSLGGGMAINNLYFAKNGNDLLLGNAGGDRVTFKDWYASSANHSFSMLQVIEAAAQEYNPQSADYTINKKVEEYDFGKMVMAFDQARTANPALSYWSLMNGKLDAHLRGSDTAALGGDLAFQYGMTGNVTQIGLAGAASILKSPEFGKTEQGIH